MRLFYLIIFCVVGLGCIAAAWLGLTKYLGFKFKNEKLSRIMTAVAGVALMAYGIAYFCGLI